MAANGISTLTYKRDRQLAKLELAASKRGEEYDITELPTQYAPNDNDTNNVINNSNSSGLLQRRPWSAGGITLDELVTNLDPRVASGTTVIDQSGNDNNATVVGGATYDATEDALVLDGTDDYLRTSNLYSAIGNPDTFSVGVWAKPAAGGVVVQVTNTTTPEVAYHFSAIEFVESAGNPVPYFGLWNGTSITDDNGPALSYDTWYHMVLTYNGTTVKGYINGSEVASANVTYDSPHDDGETTQYLLFGAGTTTNMGDGSFYTGGLGEARIYNKALSPAEVLENYNTTKGRYGL
jgi:hypothetical protein